MKFFRLNELTDSTGVTPRTIRYYIAEGLLPPPQGAGPAAVYTAAHRDRLQLIGRLKDQYLPLREIRRRLATLTDAQVRAELRAQGQDTEAVPSPILASAPSPSIIDEPSNSSTPPPVYSPVARLAVPTPTPAPAREQWERIVLADGIELHVRDDRRHERLLLNALIRKAHQLLGEP